MIVTNRFAFIHVHKTGGQFVTQILKTFFPDARACGYHYPRSCLPPELQSLPVIAFLRNPWSWYVSWYTFNAARPKMNPLYRVTSAEGTHDFEGTIRNLVTLGEASAQASELRSMLTGMLPESMHGNTGSGLTRSCIQKMEGQTRGYFSWLVERMLGPATELSNVSLGHQESLREDLTHLLTPYYEGDASALASAIRSLPIINSTSHDHYHAYYSDSLRDLVRERDTAVIELGNYVF